VTVDTKQERLAALKGHLMEDVKFGGGLFGHLDKGGKFEVRQTEVAAGQWEMTTLVVAIAHNLAQPGLFLIWTIQRTAGCGFRISARSRKAVK
jgi:hypothetical protein